MLTHQPIAGQEQVRCTCGADDDLEDGLGLSPSPLSPAHHVSDHTGNDNAPAPVLEAERRLNQRLLENVSEKPNLNMQSKSDTLVPVMRETKRQESTNNNSSVPLESQYTPEVQLKYKDSNAQTTSQAANNVNVDKKVTATSLSSSREPKTPFVPGFQTLGRNYNMPEYLIKWQADQFERSERRHRQELARQGRLEEDVNPAYLNKETGQVPPKPVVRSKSTQVKAGEADPQELGHAVQKEKSSLKVLSNKAKATKTEKVTFLLGVCAYLLYYSICSCILDLLTYYPVCVCVMFCVVLQHCSGQFVWCSVLYCNTVRGSL